VVDWAYEGGSLLLLLSEEDRERLLRAVVGGVGDGVGRAAVVRRGAAPMLSSAGSWPEMLSKASSSMMPFSRRDSSSWGMNEWVSLVVFGWPMGPETSIYPSGTQS
jgi:hypothetical protein